MKFLHLKKNKTNEAIKLYLVLFDNATSHFCNSNDFWRQCWL